MNNKTRKELLMKKIIAGVLLIIMLSSIMISCARQDETAKETSGVINETIESNDSADETTLPVDKNGYLKDNLPESLNYAGKKVYFMVWSDVENPEFYVDSTTGEMVNDAIYNRNQTVESRLNVDFEFIETPGNYSNQKNFVSTAQNMILSGSELDIMAAYSLTAAGLVAQNLAYKLNELEYLDFNMPWWPYRLVEESEINGNVYMCSGDLSTNMLHKMHAVFFDRALCRDYGVDTNNLYDMALDGTWTLDYLLEITSNVYVDLNSNGTKDKDDKYGLYMCDNYFDVFFYASDLRTTDRDQNGTPVISSTFGSEKTINLADKLGNFFANNTGAYFVTNFTEGIQMSKNGAMMIVSRCDIASKRLRIAENLDYGVLPIPKYDEQQGNYITCLAFPCTLYTVSNSTKDPDMVGAVLEALGSEGYRQITPALFETTMKVKYANDDATSEVYDIIRSSVSFDLGRIFHSSLNNICSLFRTACSTNAGNFSSVYKSNEKVIKKLLNDLITSIK